MHILVQIAEVFYFSNLLIAFILFSYLAVLFQEENEPYARKKAVYIAAFFLFLAPLSFYLFPDILSLIFSAAIILFYLILIIPLPVKRGIIGHIPTNKYDERDIMFSRKELIPGTSRFESYYLKNPEKKKLDDKWRQLPGLLSKESLYYHPVAFEKAKSYFREIKELAPRIDGIAYTKTIQHNITVFSESIKKEMKSLGALDVGITECKDYHFYSHKGRGDTYGKPVLNKHRFAIAFTVEMDQEMVSAAPKASIVMESARQYLISARISVQIAEMLRSMGYQARAHIDGNYEVICPLVARDAGLGGIGRMGILMTPKEGPRVRIGVITTDMPLKADEYKVNHAMIDFCLRCKKCADCCPSQSISFDDPSVSNGVKRWQIDSESCFNYWCKAGTDCGRCMAVCPYSHPNNSLHKLIRFGIQYSGVFRRIAVYLDDYFYGKKPKSKELPDHIINHLNQ